MNKDRSIRGKDGKLAGSRPDTEKATRSAPKAAPFKFSASHNAADAGTPAPQFDRVDGLAANAPEDLEKELYYATRVKESCTRMLFRAIPEDVLVAPDPDTRTLISAARGVIASPDRYSKETRREISRLIVELETANGELVVVAARSGDTSIDPLDLRSARSTAQVSCMQYADAARNALDLLHISWSGDESDDSLMRSVGAYLYGVQTSGRDLAGDELELRSALKGYSRNRDIDTRATDLLAYL